MSRNCYVQSCLQALAQVLMRVKYLLERDHRTRPEKKSTALISHLVTGIQFGLVLTGSYAVGAEEARASRRPNVIIIMTDDQGFGELSAHGNPVLKTPALDRLHAESQRFIDFHVAPMCTPTRGQLLTGVDAARNGAANVASGRSLLRRDIPTIANLFSAQGYATGIFGKWHLGDNAPYRPQDRGFQESIWFPASHISSAPDHWANDYFNPVLNHNGKRTRFSGYVTDIFFDEAISWINSRVEADEPFLAYIPTNAPHWPHWAPDKELEEARKAMAAVTFKNMSPATKEQLTRYLAMIMNIDSNVKKLDELLARAGIADDTILVFLTDNGSTFGPSYYNAGMRGHKTELFEGGHRVPLFIRWPNGGFGSPRDIGGLSEVQDLVPTLIDLAGISPPSDRKFDGISLAATLRGKTAISEDRMLVINYSRLPLGFDYPTPDAPSLIRREGAAVLWKRWRLLEDRELYDLAKDPLQQNNVIGAQPRIASKMRAHLDNWWKGVRGVANEPQAIVIGSDREDPTMLTAVDWLDVLVDIQMAHIRPGVRKNGYWVLDVARGGNYEFELRRWPREANTPLSAGMAGGTVVAGDVLPPGEALPISRASLFIGQKFAEKVVGSDDVAATFRVTLEPGRAMLHTWFDDQKGNPIAGAYYVYVKRIPR